VAVNVYISCALTHVPRPIFPTYVTFIHRLAAALSEEGSSYRVKYALVNSDPQLAAKPFNERARLCYLWDREMVEEADVVVAEASFPGIGLGIELQLAEARKTPTIICFSDYGVNRTIPAIYENPDHTRHDLQIGSGYVSLMALGLPNVFRVVQYESADDGIVRICDVLALIDR
jgi:hypothetical protein